MLKQKLQHIKRSVLTNFRWKPILSRIGLSLSLSQVFLSLSATFDVLSTSALASYHSPMLTCPFYSKEAITQALLWTWSWWSFKSEASNCTRRTLRALLRRFLLFVFCFFVCCCVHIWRDARFLTVSFVLEDLASRYPQLNDARYLSRSNIS
jgi:hypothetical protein